MRARRQPLLVASPSAPLGARGLSVLLASLALSAPPGCGGRPSGVRPSSPHWGAIRSDDVERGENRFMVVCAPCHVHHDMREAPPLVELGWTASEIRHQIREGSALMPSIPRSRLSDADVEPLLAYLETIGAAVDHPAGAAGLDSPLARSR